jgi:predicted amidohydrolase YtcJ
MRTTIFHNGPIVTMQPQQRPVEAVAVRGERILAVGSLAEVRAAAGSGADSYDLRGRPLLPGLTDAHVHIVWHGLWSRQVQLAGMTDYQQVLAKIAAAAPAVVDGAWLRGTGWDHTAWGGNWPTRHDLDRVCPQHPAVMTRKDGHSLWCNSAALARAGITAATTDPAGGQIQRDAAGEPTGILTETAMDLVKHVMPEPSKAERLTALQSAIAEGLSYGLTSLHCPPGTTPGDGAETLIDFQTLYAAGGLKARLLAHFSATDLESVIALGIRTGLGDDWLRLGSLKLFADGSLGSESAHMLAPYEGRTHTGIAVIEPPEMKRLVQRANSNGIAVIVHAIGDAANRSVLDAIEAARPTALPLAHANRIEHCQILDPNDIPRFAQLGVIAGMQPIHICADMPVAQRLWGERNRGAYAWKSLLNAGATLALGSDAPVETLDPWASIFAAVTRQTLAGAPEGGWYPQERLTIEEALEGYIIGPAIASAEADRKGRIAPGMLADLTVLNQNPLTVAAGDLQRTHAELTMVGGQVMFER